MASKPRSVLDINVFVSGLINPRGAPAAFLRVLRAKRCTLISRPPINEEIIAVLARNSHRSTEWGVRCDWGGAEDIGSGAILKEWGQKLILSKG